MAKSLRTCSSTYTDGIIVLVHDTNNDMKVLTTTPIGGQENARNLEVSLGRRMHDFVSFVSRSTSRPECFIPEKAENTETEMKYG